MGRQQRSKTMVDERPNCCNGRGRNIIDSTLLRIADAFTIATAGGVSMQVSLAIPY